MRFRSSSLAALLGALIFAAPAAAEIYRWTDASGRMHFTQDLNQVPPRYRGQAEASVHLRKSADETGSFQSYSGGASGAGAAPAARAQGPDDATVHRIRVQRAGTSMLVNVRLNGSVTAPFLIDTGATDVLIPESVARQAGLEFGAGSRTKQYGTANGIVEHPVVMLRSVELGGARVEDVPASVSPHMDVGLLGLSFFNHFTYNIDAASGVVSLRRNDLASAGLIRGGRSQAQWSAEYAALQYRAAALEREYAQKAEAKSRERGRLEEARQELERQLSLLEAEADRARVPLSWRR